MTEPVHDAELLEAARTARDSAYAPYSGFKVGAAVRSTSGAVYRGCNVENASYGATLCAERVALAAMIVAGETRAASLAVYAESDELSMPCGICRQALFELAAEPQAALPVSVAGPSGTKLTTLGALLPEPFRLRR
jgi:cytidine deaminase